MAAARRGPSNDPTEKCPPATRCSLSWLWTVLFTDNPAFMLSLLPALAHSVGDLSGPRSRLTHPRIYLERCRVKWLWSRLLFVYTARPDRPGYIVAPTART